MSSRPDPELAEGEVEGSALKIRLVPRKINDLQNGRIFMIFGWREEPCMTAVVLAFSLSSFAKGGGSALRLDSGQ